MLAIGFKYEVQKNLYYVDENEKEAAVKYRWSFVDHYLEYEMQMFH